MQDKKEHFTGLVKTIKNKVHDWKSKHLWAVRSLEYYLLFVLVVVVVIYVFDHLSLLHTEPTSALYMLSALVQSQAAIVAIVITLTLIAVQLTASAYSPRVIRIFRDYPDMRILLGFYGFSIFLGLLVLKMIRSAEDSSQIVIFNISLESSIIFVYALGISTFAILFLYVRNIMNLVTSENIINRLKIDITKGNLLNSKEDPIQPIMDIIHGSIMKYDIETTRVGLKAVTDQVTKIIEPGMEVEISSHFCHHLERVSRLAISKKDEESAIEVIESIGNFGLSTARRRLKVSTWDAVVSLGSVGGDAARKGLAHAAWEVAESLGIIGIATAEEGLDGVTRQAVRTLRYVGKVTAGRRPESVTEGAVTSLVDVGIATMKKGLKDVTNQAALYLAELTILSEGIIIDVIQNFESNLKEQDRDAFQKFMKIYEQELEELRAEK